MVCVWGGGAAEMHFGFDQVKLCAKVVPHHTHTYIRHNAYVKNYNHGDDAKILRL
jgi:hypothetical protein